MMLNCLISDGSHMLLHSLVSEDIQQVICQASTGPATALWCLLCLLILSNCLLFLL